MKQHYRGQQEVIFSRVKVCSCSVPTTQSLDLGIFHPIPGCHSSCPNPKSVPEIPGLVHPHSLQCTSQFIHQLLPSQKATILVHEQWPSLVFPYSQVGQNGQHQTKVLSCLAYEKGFLLPKRTCLQLFQVNP